VRIGGAGARRRIVSFTEALPLILHSQQAIIRE
jgi:hypothetical protein